jgi:hypothetical protein
MAKKSAKNRPKQPTTANFDDAAVKEVTATHTTPLASTPQVDAHAPATTRLSFFNFITVATTKDIENFLELADTTQESDNLRYLWERAYEDGFENGRRSLLQNLGKKMEDNFEEGVRRGMDLGREEGYTVAKEAFDDIIRVVKAREATKVDTSDAGTQTNPTRPATTSQVRTFIENGIGTRSAPTVDISVQKSPKTALPTSYSTSGTQTNTLVDFFVQTNPISTQASCHIIKPPLPSSTPTSVPPSTSTATIGTQSEIRTSQHPIIGSPTHVATSQCPELLVNKKNAKKAEISTTNANTSEILQKPTVFSPPTPSAAATSSSTSSSTTTALEMQPMLANFVQNHQKCEKSPNSSQTTPIFAKNANDAFNVLHLTQIEHAGHPVLENASTNISDSSPYWILLTQQICR